MGLGTLYLLLGAVFTLCSAQEIQPPGKVILTQNLHVSSSGVGVWRHDLPGYFCYLYAFKSILGAF